MDTRTTSALLYLDGVTVSFDGFHALNNLSLTLEPGEMRAIIGPNGAGKTTMMDIITGKTRPDEGDVLFDGSTDLTTARRDRDRRARHRPQIPEADGVRDARRVEDNLLLALKVDRACRAHAVLARERGRSASGSNACSTPSG